MATSGISRNSPHSENDDESYFTAIPDGNHLRLGFKNALISKYLMVFTVTVTFGLKFLPQKYSSNFYVCPTSNNNQYTAVPYFLSGLHVDHAWDLFGYLLLIFCFRSIERKWGSAKFVVFILWTQFVSLSLMVALLSWYSNSNLATKCLPSGLISPLFALVICQTNLNSPDDDAATTSLTSLAFSKKFIISMTCLQIMSSNQLTMIHSVIGLIIGVIYRLNIFGMKSFGVPSFIRGIVSNILCIPNCKYGPCAIGSTPETHDDMVYDFILQNRRSFSSRQQRAGGLSNFLPVRALRQLSGFFDRQRNGTQNNPPNVEPVTITEDKIQTLLDMGFTRVTALQALQMVNGNVQSAAEVLLSRQAI